MATPNRELFDQAVSHAIGLRRLSTGVANKVVGVLDAADADIEAIIKNYDPASVGKRYTAGRMQGLLKDLRVLNKEVYKNFGSTIKGDLGELAMYEGVFQATKVGKTLEGGTMRIPSRSLLVAAAIDEPFQGRLLSEWVEGLEAGRYAKLRDTVRFSVVEGESINDTVKRIRGTKALGYKDGVLQTSRRSAEAMARTAVNHTVTRSQQLTYEENADILDGWRFVAVLDSRTTIICQELDGQEFEIGEGPYPPRHINCRSTTVPIVEGGGDVERTTYGEWLGDQDEETQDEALGVTRAKLFRDGDLKVGKFTDDGRVLSLDELKAREPAAFAKVAAKKPVDAGEAFARGHTDFVTELPRAQALIRDAKIMEMVAAGVSQAEIAKIFGMARSGVAGVVAKHAKLAKKAAGGVLPPVKPPEFVKVYPPPPPEKPETIKDALNKVRGAGTAKTYRPPKAPPKDAPPKAPKLRTDDGTDRVAFQQWKERNPEGFEVMGQVDEKYIRGMDNALSHYPPEARQLLDEVGTRFHVIDGPRNHEFYNDLPQATAYGGAGNVGRSYDDVGGWYTWGSKKAVTINAKAADPRGWNNTTMNHEIGHALDNAIGLKTGNTGEKWGIGRHARSHAPDFKAAWKADVKALSSADKNAYRYYVSEGGFGEMETFAESFNNFMGTNSSAWARPVAEKFPESYKVMLKSLEEAGLKFNRSKEVPLKELAASRAKEQAEATAERHARTLKYARGEFPETKKGQ